MSVRPPAQELATGSGKRVAIIGAGPAGLTSALLLQQRAWQVEVFERRATPKEDAVTNGNRSIIFALMRRGTRALKEAGVELPSRATGELWKNNMVVGKGMVFHSPKDGKVSSLPTAGIDEVLLAEREALTEALSDLARSKDGLKVHYNASIGNIDFEKKKLEYKLQEGAESALQYDLLLGCDGRNSQVRKQLAEFQPSVKYETNLTGKSWKSFSGLPRIEGLHGDEADGEYAGSFARGDTRILVWPTRNGTIGGYVVRPTECFTEDNNSFQYWKDFIQKESPYYPKQWVDETARQLVDSPVGHIGNAWCSTSAGPSTVLLGDAVNSIAPVLGQGVNSALESCKILVEELEKHEDINEACQAFNTRRHPDLQALNLLDKEAPDRFGLKGPFNLRFISFTFMQYIVWRNLYKLLPSVFGVPESAAMQTHLSYKKARAAFQRDENIVKTGLAFSFGLLAFGAAKAAQLVQ